MNWGDTTTALMHNRIDLHYMSPDRLAALLPFQYGPLPPVPIKHIKHIKTYQNTSIHIKTHQTQQIIHVAR
jgi:hypothetical protein